MEDARLYMQGQERTARSSGQRQWLATGVSPSGPSRCERSALQPGQEEVDAMTQAAAAAKAKAGAEAEEIAREVSRRKKAEHNAKVAEAAMENIKKEAAKKKLEVLAAIEEEANDGLAGGTASRDTPAASSDQAAAAGRGPSCRSLPLSPSSEGGTLHHKPLPPARGARAALTSRATEPLSWEIIFNSPDDYLRPLRAKTMAPRCR